MKTKLMGILNITPDSFFDGGKYDHLQAAIERGLAMEAEGADILDIGGESSRPYATPVTEEEELARVIPVIQELRRQLSLPISIDTIKPTVARLALEAGATMLNDISGCVNPEMQEIAAAYKVPICVMHMQGTPQTMQANPNYEASIVDTILSWFQERVSLLLKAGIEPHQIILDPGIGFGKTVAHNIEIIHNLRRFKALDFPLLLGVSRKSFMSKTLNKPPSDLLPTTLAINALAISDGVDMIRVHDVKEHRDVIDMLDAMTPGRSSAVLK